jgi:hypothetical protein
VKKVLAAYGRIVNKWCRKKETYASLIVDALRDSRECIVSQKQHSDWRLCRCLITSREVF